MKLLAAALLLSALPLFAERRGAVAFHYGPALSREQLDFFGRFDVLVTHDPLPRKQVDELHRRGTKLALYEWAVAFYRTRRTRWDRIAPVLNRKPLRGGVGAADADAFYYDPAIPGRASALAAKLRNVGYDGVFFDTTTEGSVHPEALAVYRKRHPELPYDVAFSNFLRDLRTRIDLIITNQGYRAAGHYLPHVDYDVTESLLMRPRDEIDAVMREWILPHENTRFIHLNYAEPGDDAAIARMIRIAREYGHEAYVAFHDVTKTAFHDDYFRNAGVPPAEQGASRPRPPKHRGETPPAQPARTPALHEGPHALP